MLIAHSSSRWRRPRPLALPGLKLLRTVKGRFATVIVDAELAGPSNCEAGKYRLRVDDSLGQARILAVLRHGLLLEQKGRLRYLSKDGGHAPQWMMAWGSRYAVQGKNGVRGSRSTAHRRKPKRKPPRRRKRPRKRR